MIDLLVLHGFQAHEKLVLRLDPRVTCLVGPSDRGKSSVLRALKWLATNRPSGSEFLRWGSKSVRVKVKADGKTVEREKGQANLYRLGSDEFKAFGQDVPEQIASLLNLGEINFLVFPLTIG